MPFLAPVLVAMGSTGAAIGAGLGAVAGGLSAIGGGSALAGAGTLALGGASILGAKKAGEAAERATTVQVQAGQEALDVQLQIFREQQEAQEPFRQAGVAATQQLSGLAGLQGPEAQQAAFGQFETSPGFEFRQQQGQQAVERGAAARGGLLSGKGLRGVTEVSQGIASQEFGNYVSALQSLAGLGPQATAQQAAAGGTFAANQSTTLQNIGAARASGFGAKNQAFQTGLQGVADVVGFGLGNI